MSVNRIVVTVVAPLMAGVAALAFAAAPALARPETPTTQAPSPIEGTSVVFHGVLNPNASATTGYYFNYGQNGTCEEEATGLAAEATGEGIKVSAPVTGLEGSTEYMVCVVATHLEVEGTEKFIVRTWGLPVPFTTLAAKPAVAGGEVTGITPTTGTVRSTVNPEKQTTSCVVEYGETLAYGETVDCEPESLTGSEPQPVAVTLTGLKSATTYHYRVKATNATGATESPGVFKTLTLETPIVESESDSNVTSSSARLEAQINPNYQETTYEFEYAANPALTEATKVPSENILPAEFAGQPVSLTITGLQPRTTYYYRVVATNGTGKKDGTIESFTTLAAPVVMAGEAPRVAQTKAEVSGTVNPGGVPTSAYIVYISQQGYEAAGGAGAANPYRGGRTTLSISVGADFTEHSVGTTLLELAPGTTYHYAVVATNAIGTTTGPDMTLTTAPPTPPLAITGAAVGVSQSAATITGAVNTQELPTTEEFEFGTTPYSGSFAPVTAGSTSGSTVSISATFNDLQPGTTYYYRTLATNPDGTEYGAEQSFTTPGYPSPFTSTPTPAFIPYTSIAALDATEAHEGKLTTPLKKKTKTKKKKKLKKHTKAKAKKKKK
jgi:hypothetical protein